MLGEYLPWLIVMILVARGTIKAPEYLQDVGVAVISMELVAGPVETEHQLTRGSSNFGVRIHCRLDHGLKRRVL